MVTLLKQKESYLAKELKVVYKTPENKETNWAKKGSFRISKFDEYKERIVELRNLGLSYQKISLHIGIGTAPAIQNYLNKLEKIK